MDRQTQVSSNGIGESTGRRVVRNAAELWHHVMLLGELQGRLLLVELGEGFRKARTGVLFVVCGALLGLASVPVVLAALALVLVETAGLTLAQAFGIAAGAAVALSLSLALGGWIYLRSQTLGAPRSRAEWSLNWRWLKTLCGANARRAIACPPMAARNGAESGSAIYILLEAIMETRSENHTTQAPPHFALPQGEMKVLEDLQAYFEAYARERPATVALTCLAVGFVLGWRLKPW